MSDSIEIKSDGSWVFHGENSWLKEPERNSVPNFRLTNPITGETSYQELYRVYCMNCGKDGGLSAKTAVWVKYLCNNCFEKGCPDWFIPMLPDEEVAWRNGLD